MKIKFRSAEEMAELIHGNHDFYNEDTGIYVFRYSEKGSICYYRLSIDEAKKLSETIRVSGESYWGTCLGPGGYILDDPDEINEFFEEHYNNPNWVFADDRYGMKTRYKNYYILKTGSYPDEKTYPESFDTFEKAYDKMCILYAEEQRPSKNNPTGVPNRWGIYSVSESEWSGSVNTMIQPTWN